LWSGGRRNIQNLSKKVAQGYNEKGDGVNLPVLSYKTNISAVARGGAGGGRAPPSFLPKK